MSGVLGYLGIADTVAAQIPDFPEFADPVIFAGFPFANVFSDAGVTPASGTDPVQEIHDYLGGGNIATGVGATRPVLVQNALNGKPLLNFNGNKRMEIVLPANYTGDKIWLAEIFKVNSLGDQRRLMSFVNNMATGIDYQDGAIIYTNGAGHVANYMGAADATSAVALQVGEVYVVISKWDRDAVTKQHSVQVNDEVPVTTTDVVTGEFDIKGFVLNSGLISGAYGNYSDIQSGGWVIVGGWPSAPEEAAFLDWIQDPAVYEAIF